MTLSILATRPEEKGEDETRTVELLKMATPRQSAYYLNDVWDRRGLEDGHVLLWMLKDLSWILCWHQNVVAAIGCLAIALSLQVILLDAIEVFKKGNRSRHRFIDSIKELITSVGVVLWLGGNVWWAYGEVSDLRTTAGYNDVYEKFVGEARYSFFCSFLILCPFWIGVFITECFGLSKSAYEVRLVRQIQRDLLVRGTVKYDLPIIEPLNETSQSICSKLSNDEQCFTSPKNRDIFQRLSPMGIPGMPYRCAGLVGVPKGYPDWRHGGVKSRATIKLSSGVISYRDWENFIVFWWLLKDLAWVYEDPLWAKCMWFCGAVMALTITLDISILLLVNMKKCFVKTVDIVHAISLAAWVICNVIWCAGEMFIDDYVEDLPEDPQEAIAYLVPGLFTAPADLPRGPWLARFIAAWILLLAVLSLIIMYALFILHDISVWFKARKVRTTRMDVEHPNGHLNMNRPSHGSSDEST